MVLIIYPCFNLSLTMFAKGAPGLSSHICPQPVAPSAVNTMIENTDGVRFLFIKPWDVFSSDLKAFFE